MAFQSVPYTFQLNQRWVLSGQQCLTTFYASVDPGDYNSGVATDVLTEFRTWVTSELIPVFPAGVVFGNAEIKGLMNAADIFQFSSFNAGDPGGVGTANQPGNVVVSIKRSSGLTGRSERGRVYIPVPDNGLTTNENAVDATWLDSVVDALNFLRSSLTAAGAVEAIVSRFTGGAARATGIAIPVAFYIAVDANVDSMRRRLTGRGT